MADKPTTLNKFCYLNVINCAPIYADEISFYKPLTIQFYLLFPRPVVVVYSFHYKRPQYTLTKLSYLQGIAVQCFLSESKQPD